MSNFTIIFLITVFCGSSDTWTCHFLLKVSPNVHPLLLLQRAAQRDQPAETINQKSEAQMAAPLLPNTEQPQPGILQQPDPQTSPQPSLQQYTMLSQGVSPMIIPLPQHLYPSLGTSQLTVAQQPMVGNKRKWDKLELHSVFFKLFYIPNFELWTLQLLIVDFFWQIYPAYGIVPLFPSPYNNQMVRYYYQTCFVPAARSHTSHTELHVYVVKTKS